MKYGFINLINMVKKQILNNIGCDVHVIGCSMFFDIETITATIIGKSIWRFEENDLPYDTQ